MKLFSLNSHGFNFCREWNHGPDGFVFTLTFPEMVDEFWGYAGPHVSLADEFAEWLLETFEEDDFCISFDWIKTSYP